MIRPVSADGRIETGGAFTPILRPRVVERIASATIQRIVLIVAPAGYGKSVALRQYLEGADVPHVRYDVRADNANLLGFVRGFADALDDAAPDARKTVSGAFEESRTSKTPGVDLAMWMHAHIKTLTGLIAIDDLHVAEGDPEISKFLVSLIERTKGRSRWLIASRSSLDLPVGSWLAYGEMDLTIDEQDLQFTLDEARLTARASRVGVRDEELASILTMTQGWPTALSFALRTSTRSVDLRNIAASTREMVYRYLAEQVYQSLDGTERELLHFIGYLPQIDLEVLQHAGYVKSKALVESLRDRVAFIYPDRPDMYHCHDLFRDFLQHQVELQGADAPRAVQTRAAQALEAAGQIAFALDLYAAANSHDHVIRLLQAHGFALIERGHADSVHGAVESLPQNVRATHPIVLGMRALREAEEGSYDRAESLLVRAIARSDDPVLSATLSVRLALILLNLGRDAGSLLAPLRLVQALPKEIEVEIAGLLAVNHSAAGRPDEARAAIEACDGLAGEIDSDAHRAKLLQRVGVAAFQIGMPVETVQRYLTKAASLATEQGMLSLAGRAYGALGNVAGLYEDDATKCVWLAQQTLMAATKSGDRIALQTALLQMLTIEGVRGNGERRVALEAQFAEVITSDAARGLALIPGRAMHIAGSGEFAEAVRILAPAMDRLPFIWDRAFSRALSGLCYVTAGNRERGVAMLAAALLEVSGEQTPYRYGKRQFETARLLCAAGEALAGCSTAAVRILQQPAIHESPMTHTLREGVVALSRTVKNSALREEALERFQSLTPLGYGGIGRVLCAVVEGTERQQSDAALLTRTELSILQSLAQGLGPKEIAAETGRSVYTVQTHVQNVIKKLRCSGRQEALAAAQVRGLLG